MSCAVGKCGHCKINETYVCLEGPVFNYTRARDLLGLKTHPGRLHEMRRAARIDRAAHQNQRPGGLFRRGVSWIRKPGHTGNLCARVCVRGRR